MRVFDNQGPHGIHRRDELAESIAGRIIRIQSRLAGYLDARAARISKKTLLRLLILFIALFSGINLYLIIHPIIH